MLLRNFIQAARLMQNKNAYLVFNRNISSTPMLLTNFRPPPFLPKVVEDGDAGAEEVQEFDPKSGSLEEYLCIRFGPEMPTIHDDEDPRRDLKNFPRPVQPDFAEPCRLGIIPESWFNFFYEKTGVTGPYCFFWGFLTFLLSKEWLIFEHEILVGIQVTAIIVAGSKMFGKTIRQKAGSTIDENYKSWEDWQKGMIGFLNEMIKSEENIRDSSKNFKVLFDAKRENIQLQLEAEFRKRQMEAYNEVKKRLDYLVAKENAEQQFKQKHMVNWIIDNVAKSITSTQEQDTLKNTLAELKKLSSKVTI